MIRSTMSGWQLVFTTRLFFPFILGAISLGVLGNSIYDLIKILFGSESLPLTLTAVFSITVIILMVPAVNYFLYRNQDQPDLRKASPEKRKGLILLISPNTPASVKAIEYHSEILRECWLICSEKSLEYATDDIEPLFENYTISFHRELINDSDIYDPLVLKNKVERIYKNLPEHFIEDDIILDFTGMSSVASVGAVLATLTGNRPIQFTPAAYDENLKARGPLNPIEIKIS